MLEGKKSAYISLAVERTFVPLDVFPDESVLKSIDVRQRRLRLFEVCIDFLYFSTVSELCFSTRHPAPDHRRRVSGRMHILIFNISERRVAHWLC